jgi:hypothetical protein
MSTKSHFIYEHGIEGFEETSEPQSIFGKLQGYNAYLIIDLALLKSVKIKGDYLFIETRDTTHLPEKFKIWGDAVIEAEFDYDGLLIILKGGHHVTKSVVAKDFAQLIGG